ncbi:hypothetical protein T06_2859 [Trichinella sp. T6]|nr:hypothetical protein T06_2859 [Trichinella sp. T6]
MYEKNKLKTLNLQNVAFQFSWSALKKILWALVDMFRFDGFRSGQTTSWLVLLADIVFLTLIYIGHVLYG